MSESFKLLNRRHQKRFKIRPYYCKEQLVERLSWQALLNILWRISSNNVARRTLLENHNPGAPQRCTSNAQHQLGLWPTEGIIPFPTYTHQNTWQVYLILQWIKIKASGITIDFILEQQFDENMDACHSLKSVLK